MEFHLERCPAGLLERVEALEPVVTASYSGRVLTVLTGTGEAQLGLIESLGRLADETGGGLALRRILEPSLETLFLDVTGKQLKDGSGDQSGLGDPA